MLNDDCLTVVHDGEQQQIELKPYQAEHLIEFLQNTAYAPHRPGGIPPEQQEAARERLVDTEVSAGNFQSHLKKLAALSPDDLAALMAFVDVIKFGDGRLHGGNWILAFIMDLMRNVRCKGVATTLETDPRGVLSDLAYDLSQFWSWMTDGTDLQKRHPGLFAPQVATPEPPAASETTQTTTKQTSKAQRAQKAKRKGARA